MDADGDGVDDQTDMLDNALAIMWKPVQNTRAVIIRPVSGRWLWRVYRCGGFCAEKCRICLQALVDADIREHPQWYDIRQPDANIDFRRVRNLKVFFAHHAASLTTDVSRTEEWQGGDLVIFEKHIGIVSDRRNPGTVCPM